MLYVHATNAAEWLWVDQLCVPQDAPVEVKMAHVRESLDIYRKGKVRLACEACTFRLAQGGWGLLREGEACTGEVILAREVFM